MTQDTYINVFFSVHLLRTIEHVVVLRKKKKTKLSNKNVRRRKRERETVYLSTDVTHYSLVLSSLIDDICKYDGYNNAHIAFLQMTLHFVWPFFFQRHNMKNMKHHNILREEEKKLFPKLSHFHQGTITITII